MSAASPRSRLKHPWAVGCALVAGVALVLGGVVGLYLYRKASAPPAKWVRMHTHMRQISETDRARMADHFYKRMVNELSSIRDPRKKIPATRHLILGIDAINAWLDQKLPSLLANQGVSMPPNVRDPMIAVEDGHLIAAFRTGDGAEGKVVSLTFDPLITQGGKARLKLLSIHLGQLPIPRSVALAQIRSPKDDKKTRAMVEYTARVLEGDAFDPLFPVDRSRQVRVLAIEVKPDAVELTIRTQPRRGYHGQAVDER